MASGSTSSRSDEHSVITVRLWAAAKAAAEGVDSVGVQTTSAISLAEVTERVLIDRPERLAAVLASCSVLVGEQPVSRLDPATVMIEPGGTVEFLPPFAGG